MQLRRHCWRSQETHRGANRNGLEEDPAEEVVRQVWCYVTSTCNSDLVQWTRRYTIYKDHITLADYEIHDGMSLEMY